MSNLAITMRPEKLEDVIGSEHVKKSLRSFAEKDNWPNVFLFQGPPGTGKTTFAMITAKMAGAEGDGLHEINASGNNGVDFARELEEMAKNRPFSGRRRAFILNEFHQFTGPAQNALKDPMERGDALWILTTDRPDKVEAAIKSRASAATFDLKPLNSAQIYDLVVDAAAGRLSQHEAPLIRDFLIRAGIGSPREILGVLDLHLSGTPLEQCISGAEHEPLYKEVASAVLSGNWARCAATLEKIKTADYRGMVGIVSAFLAGDLLKCSVGSRADALATCLVGLGSNQFQDGVAYAATKAILYKACKVLETK